ncbi:DUF294 nucleotidyltransferase-like domain-containing protein [Photobacterium ganghwense]|uniref:DUF294 nucleotidyltransferase-like domain-containing protein n=1 Tax=Photobacterium ganghwense TaxID=320778 RepID=UPI0040573BAE
MEQSLLPNIFDYLSTVDPFDHLTPAARDALAASVDILYLMKGDELAGQKIVGQGLFIVRLGAVEQCNPDRSLRARLADGDLFGFSQLHKSEHCDYTLTAIENTLLYRIPKQVLMQLIEEIPAVRDHFASQESVRLATTATMAEAADEALYLKPVRDVANTNMALVSASTSIHEVAKTMVEKHRSSALVMDGDKLLGIVTDRDMTKRVIVENIPLTSPVAVVMTRDPQVIDGESSMIEAIESMMQHNVRSLPVMDKGNVIGVLTATSLVEKSQVQAVFLISRIYRQESLEDLKALIPQRHAVFETLVDTGMHSRSVQQLMTLVADAFNKRLLQLAERELGPAPIPYAWFVAGSQARNEIHNLSDQDNGLILARQPDSEEKEYFRRLTEFVCYGLAECGYILCPGHMMATNPKWCASLEQWLEYYRDWIIHPDSQGLLNISVFLDVRFLFGQQELVEALQHKLTAYMRGNQRFLAMLVANSLRVHPPLGMFRQFVLAKDGENRSVFNIKKQAVNLLVELTRIYALAAESQETEMSKRLEAAVKGGIISAASQQELIEACNFINQVRFRHQRLAHERGEPASNNIAPSLLTQFERNHLKDAFRIISRYQEAAQQRFHAKGVLR